MVKKFIKITAFLLAVVLLFVCSYFVLGFKYTDSIFKMKMFYEQEDNTVDVLVLGSSHAYQGINTAVLWKEYGYPAYDLCGAAQPIWNTYYYLEEALKTQTPKVIILDTYTLHYSTDYSETSYGIKNTYGLKWSKTKIDAIKASFNEEEYGKQYFFEFLQYHSRYSDLNRADFYSYQANKDVYKYHKGFYCYFRSEPVNYDENLFLVEYQNEMTEKTESYYRKIFELAKSRNIPVIAAAIPFAAEKYHQGFFNTAKRIAEEYNMPFYNFLTDYKDELGLDYNTDFSDNQHLNYLGNTKLTRFFGNLLKDKYNMTDRRGDEKYSSWEKDSEVYYNQLENHNVTLTDSLNDYISVFKNERYKIIMTETYDIGKEKVPELNAFFSKIGVSEDEYKRGGMWVFEGGQKTYYNECTQKDFYRTVRLDGVNTALVKKSGERNAVYFNKTERSNITNGINIYVYDTFTKSTVDAVCFDYSSGDFYRKSD